MLKILKNSWALFTGYFVLMIAHGFQGNLLGVRSVIEEFNFLATGAMMSGYFVGYFVGANSIPKIVGKVGHIRVFAAFASMASLSILIHAIFVNPVVWTCGRFITGLSIVSIFIVAGVGAGVLSTLKPPPQTRDLPNVAPLVNSMVLERHDERPVARRRRRDGVAQPHRQILAVKTCHVPRRATLFEPEKVDEFSVRLPIARFLDKLAVHPVSDSEFGQVVILLTGAATAAIALDAEGQQHQQVAAEDDMGDGTQALRVRHRRPRARDGGRRRE